MNPAHIMVMQLTTYKCKRTNVLNMISAENCLSKGYKRTVRYLLVNIICITVWCNKKHAVFFYI